MHVLNTTSYSKTMENVAVGLHEVCYVGVFLPSVKSFIILRKQFSNPLM